ncbi:MAG TPA: TolC family protein, partial [Candidatus Binatus sp.]|uniref:TolC family protein n=1 Tax=Candidatus Binatus sp. TaxID=2811406 RepID=UPI002F40AA09
MRISNIRAAIVLAGCLLTIATPQFAGALETLQPGEKLTLERAIELTLRNHPRGLEMKSEAIAANERVGEARAALLPQVYSAAEYLRSTDNPIGNTTFLNPGFIPRITGTLHGAPANAVQSFSTSTTDNYLGGVAVQQYLFDFGRVRGLIEQRDEEAHAASFQSQLTELELVFEAAQRYFALLAAGQKVKVYQKAIEQRSEQLHAAKVKASANLTPQIDVLTAQAALARANTDLLEVSDERDIARVALNNTMAIDRNAPDYELADVLTYQPVSGSLEAFFASAIASRPDLRALEAEARAAGAQVKQARSDYFPTAGATAGYSALGTGLPAANNFNAGIVITWPIFNGFATEHQVQEAKATQNAIRYAIEDLEQRVWLDVKSAYLQLQTSVERIHQAEATLAASSGQLELADKRYNAGLGNIIELTDAERFYIQDDAAYVDALYGYSVAKATLDRVTGLS